MLQQNRREQFASPDKKFRPIYYFNLPAPDTDGFIYAADKAIADCESGGFGALIPQLPDNTVLDGESLLSIKAMYARLLALAKEKGLSVGFYLDPAYERATIHSLDELEDNSLRAKLLICREYICNPKENIKRPIGEGTLLSAIAYSEESSEIIDLRPFIEEDRIVWTAPAGNFVVRQYLCVDDTAREGANYLSYEASYRYIQAVFSLFADVFAPYIGNTLSLLSYSGVGFLGTNRRSWDEHFNELFEARFGFDPSPYYACLFGYIGPGTTHLKAYFMTVRAAMLQNGIMKALYDFATEHRLIPFGSLSEPKLTACSFSIGDAMLNNALSPCALFDKAYMYGTNSVKVAAGAAYNFDHDHVNGELFRNYRFHDPEHLYKDAMNAFARGVNRTAMHLTPELCANSSFGDFVARVQTMLRGGKHVADIAMLYPIYQLHSAVNLYDSPTDGYEYPATQSTADYMTLINAISIYAGHDLTLLHPQTLETRCHSENGVLYLDNARNSEQFRVLVLPAAELVSLASLRAVKKFFDGGGKIIATGVLPTKGFEFDKKREGDREVKRLAKEIFGEDACNPFVMRDFCHNRNEAGGEAIFLYFNSSAVDGTKMVRSSTVNEALNSFALPYDIYLPGMPRLECTGGLNSIYPEFHTVGLHRSIPGGGMLNHIHKRHEDGDVYYFSNTSNKEYNHHVLLRGAFAVEEYNPHTGNVRKRTCGFLSYKGEIYTTLRLTLPSCSSTFFYAIPADTNGAQITEVDSIKNLRSEHAALMSEF